MQSTALPARRPALAWGRVGTVIVAFILLLVAIVVLMPGSAVVGRLTFDPAGMAYVETEGWRAYYDRNWLRALSLMLQLNHDVFGLRWPDAIQASYYATRAQMAFAGANNNVPLAQDYLVKYYAVIARGRGLNWDPVKAAEAEIRYWIVHRQVAQKPENPAPLVASLADLHAYLFTIPAEAAQSSAVERTAAAQAVDRVTGRRSLDVDADWREIETRLRAAYTIINTAIK